jgi:predicted nuclease with RNAse H fold
LSGTIRQAILDGAWVAIDAPFGFPARFSALVGEMGESPQTWNGPERGDAHNSRHRLEQDPSGHDAVIRRATDWHIMRTVKGVTPLSSVVEQITSTTLRCCWLLKEAGVTDRLGGDNVIEVYPAAALARWGLPSAEYKGSKGRQVRSDIIDKIESRSLGAS